MGEWWEEGQKEGREKLAIRDTVLQCSGLQYQIQYYSRAALGQVVVGDSHDRREGVGS